MSDERVKLSVAECDARLVPGEYVHTFMQAAGPGLVLLGAGMTRADLLALALQGKAELAGEAASKMKHGVAVFTEDGVVFCATNQ